MSEAASASRPWLMPVLLASLLVNALLLGLIAGRTATEPGGRPAAAANAPQVEWLGARVQRLPESDRKLFGAAMKPYRAAIKEAGIALIESRQEVRAVLTREPYDPEAMIQALARVRAATAIVQQRQQDAAARALAILNPEERQSLAEP